MVASLSLVSVKGFLFEKQMRSYVGVSGGSFLSAEGEWREEIKEEVPFI